MKVVAQLPVFCCILSLLLNTYTHSYTDGIFAFLTALIRQ